MGFCDLNKINQKALLDAVVTDAANKRIAGQPYNVEDTMLAFYNKLIEGGSEPDRAITALALIPGSLLAAMSISAKTAKYLAPVGGKIIELRGNATNFDYILDTIGLREDYDQRLKDAKATEEGDQNSEEEGKAEGLTTVQVIENVPLVDSGLSTTVREIGFSQDDVAVEDDPAVKANGAFIRKFIRGGERTSKNVSEGYVLDKISTYRIALVNGSQIPEGSRAQKSFLYDKAVYAFVNEQGNIVTDENGHTPHAFVRGVQQKEDGTFEFTIGATKAARTTSRLIATKANAQRLGISLEELQSRLTDEATFLGNAVAAVVEDSNLILPLNAQRGTLGTVAGGKKVSIKNIKEFQTEFLLPEGEGSGTGRVTTVTKGNKTFTAYVFNHPNYDYALVANPENLADTEYAGAVREILLSDEYSIVEKKALLENILQKQNISFDNNAVTLKFSEAVRDENGKKVYQKSSTGRRQEKRAARKVVLDLSNMESAKSAVESFVNNVFTNLPVKGDQLYEFDGPVKEGRFYEVGKVLMSNHIYNNFSVFAKRDVQGRLITPHPVIYFTPTPEDFLKYARPTTAEAEETIEAQSQKLSETLEGQVDTSVESSMAVTLKELESILSIIPEAKPVDLAKALGRDKGLTKESGLSSEATEEQIKEAKEWFENSPLSKHIGLNEFFTIVASGKVAEFTANGIKLFAGSNYTDLYHEGWHGFSQLFLTKAEKIALYKEVRKIEGDITFLEAEEILAEDFRKYRLSNGKAVMGKTPVRRGIFKRVLDFLKSLFGNTEAKTNYREMVAQERSMELIQEAYDKLYFGKFEGLTPDINNSFFLTLNKGVEGADGKVLSDQESKDVSDAMDSIVAGLIRDINSSPKEIFASEGALSAFYDQTKFVLFEKAKELAEEGKAQEAYVLATALTNFGDTKNLAKNKETSLLGYHFKSSRYLASLAKSQDITEVLDLDIVDSAEDYMEYYDKGGNEVSVKELADPSVMYAIKSMREYDESGSPKKDRFGFDQLASATRSLNQLNVMLRNSKDVSEMLSIIASKAATKKNLKFKDFLNVVGREVESQSDHRFKMQTALFQTFNKAFVPIQVAYIRVTNTFNTLDTPGGITNLDFRIKRAEGEVNNIKRELNKEFQFDSKRANTRKSSGVREINISEVIKGFKGIDRSNIVSFYQSIGILPEEIDPAFRDVLKSQSTNLVFNTQSLLTSLIKEANLLKSKNLDIIVSNPIEYLSKNYQSTINLLLELYGETIGEMGSGAKVTAERTTQFESTLNSTATIVMTALNKAKSLDDLLNNPATAHLHPDNNPKMLVNPLFRELFDANGKKKPGKEITLINVSGVTTERINEQLVDGQVISQSSEISGTKNMSLDEYSKLNQDIHTLFTGGYVENVRASDKTTSYAWKIKGSQATIRPEDFLAASGGNRATAGERKMVKQFFALIAGELATMKKYKGVELNVNDAKGNPIDLSTWQTFSDDLILSDSFKKKLYKDFVTNGELTSALDIYNELLSSVENDVNVYEEALLESSESWLNSEVQKLTDVFNTNKKLTTNDMMGMVLSNNLKNPIYKKLGVTKVDRALMEDAVKKAFVLETFFRNASYFDVVNLGLASYRNADDTIKRNTTTSTGNLFRTDEAAQTYITNKGRLLEAKYSRETGKAVKNRPYNGQLKTAILQELSIDAKEVKSEWYEMVENIFKAEGISQEEIDSILDAYRNMDEADAQAYINMDTYRQLSIASDEWTDEQEYMYNKLVAGENINNPNQYFPVRKFQYTGPLLNAGASVQALHKYSLFPLIPSVIKDTNLEKLNEAMMEAGIDYVVHESGSKAARVGKPVEAFKIDSETGNRSVSEDLAQQLEDNMNLLSVDFLRDQLRINNQFKGEATFSTQFRKLLGDGIYENGKAVNEELASAHKEFLKNIDDLVEFETEKLRSEINTKKKLVSLIRKELERREVEEFKINAIDVDRKGNLKYNLDALPSSAEMEKILNAVVNKRLLKAKLKGESLVQVSSRGFEKAEGSNDLRFYEPGKAAQVKIPLQGEYVKLLLMDHPDGQQIGNLERLNALLKDEQWMDKNRELVSMTGVRIPVQGLNSMEFFEVAEFLPSAGGNIIVVPTEMVAKSGSDFDIDKLTMYFPVISATEQREDGMFEVDTDELLGLIFNQSAQASKVYNVELSTKGANLYKNNIIKQAGNILLHPANFTKLIRPIATDIVKENSEAYNDLVVSEDRLSKTEVFSYSYNLKKQQENSIGKKALGISAKGNTYNTMFQTISTSLSDLVLYNSKYGYVTEAQAEEIVNSFVDPTKAPTFVNYRFSNINLPFGKIGDLKDSDQKNLKSDVVSQIVNGHVDMANDSWISAIAADEVMTPYLLNLIDYGVPYDYAVRFLNAPVVLEYLSIYKSLNRNPLNKAVLGQSFGDFSVRDIMLRKYANEAYLNAITVYDKEGNPKESPSNEKQLSVLRSFKNDKVLTAEELKDPKNAVSVLATFTEVTGYFGLLKGIRLNTDVDTSKSASIVDASVESESINNLSTNEVSSSFVRELMSNTVLGTFANVKDFQSVAFKDLFGVRGDTAFNEYLRSDIDSNDTVKYDKDLKSKYAQRTTKDFIAFLSNKSDFSLNAVTFTEVEQYKGSSINFVTLPAEEAQTIKEGKVISVSKDGVILIDPARVNQEKYTLSGLYGLDEAQVYTLVLEAAHVQSTSSNELTYKQALDKAAYNLNIPGVIVDVTNPLSVVQKYEAMINDPEAAEALKDITFMDAVSVFDYNSKGIVGRMLGLKADVTDVEDYERYHNEIKQLQGSTNKMVREFFTRLPEAVMTVEGNQSSYNSLLNAIPFDQVSRKLDIVIKEFQALDAAEKQRLIFNFDSARTRKNSDSLVLEDVSEDVLTTLPTDSEVEEFIKMCKS